MTTNTTPSTASQAPAVSIDTPEFLDLACKFAHESSCEEFNEDEYNSARAALVAHIDAKLAQAREEGFEEMRKVIAENAVLMADACRRATAAEAKLEAIRQGISTISNPFNRESISHFMAFEDCRDTVAALLQPQHQADESGFPG